MREWLRTQAALLACAPRIVAAVVTGNREALDNVERDVNALHGRGHGDG